MVLLWFGIYKKIKFKKKKKKKYENYSIWWFLIFYVLFYFSWKIFLRFISLEITYEVNKVVPCTLLPHYCRSFTKSPLWKSWSNLVLKCWKIIGSVGLAPNGKKVDSKKIRIIIIITMIIIMMITMLKKLTITV